MNKYPRVIEFPEKAGERPYFKTCSRCKEPLVKGENIIIIETRLNIFRGDDEVEAFHVACRPVRHPAKERP